MMTWWEAGIFWALVLLFFLLWIDAHIQVF